jgi:hypothetical protein
MKTKEKKIKHWPVFQIGKPKATGTHPFNLQSVRGVGWVRLFFCCCFFQPFSRYFDLMKWQRYSKMKRNSCWFFFQPYTSIFDVDHSWSPREMRENMYRAKRCPYHIPQCLILQFRVGCCSILTSIERKIFITTSETCGNRKCLYCSSKVHSLHYHGLSLIPRNILRAIEAKARFRRRISHVPNLMQMHSNNRFC